MCREETVILTNMCMIYDEKGSVLVQNRISPKWPGITFPGGHIEPGESFVESVIREVKEETGLTIKNPNLCGAKQFYTSEGYRYIVLLYKCRHFSGTLKSTKEGEVFWISTKEFSKYPLAEGMKEMLQVFKSENISEFYYYQKNGEEKHKLL